MASFWLHLGPLGLSWLPLGLFLALSRLSLSCTWPHLGPLGLLFLAKTREFMFFLRSICLRNLKSCAILVQVDFFLASWFAGARATQHEHLSCTLVGVLLHHVAPWLLAAQPIFPVSSSVYGRFL